MAGKRQHIQPRFLLRRFASKAVGDQVFTWLFRSSSAPVETNITNVAVERLFYGAPWTGTVDNEITEIESTFATLVDDLSNLAETTKIESSGIAECVAHLIVRRKRLREMLRESSECLFHNLIEYMEQPAHLVPMLKKYIRSSPEFTKQQRRFMLDQLSSAAFQPRIVELSQQVFPLMKAELRARIPTAVTNGHLKALCKSVAPEPISEELHKLSWSLGVITPGQEPLIMGDAVPIMLTKEGQLRGMADRSSDVEAIYLPVSPCRLVYGSRQGHSVAYGPGDLNRAIAQCSGEYIVSSTREVGEKYACKIGKTSFLFSPTELEKLLDELLSDFR